MGRGNGYMRPVMGPCGDGPSCVLTVVEDIQTIKWVELKHICIGEQKQNWNI